MWTVSVKAGQSKLNGLRVTHENTHTRTHARTLARARAPYHHVTLNLYKDILIFPPQPPPFAALKANRCRSLFFLQPVPLGCKIICAEF